MEDLVCAVFVCVFVCYSFPAVRAQSSPCHCHWTPETSPLEGEQCRQTRAGRHYWALQRTCEHFLCKGYKAWLFNSKPNRQTCHFGLMDVDSWLIPKGERYFDLFYLHLHLVALFTFSKKHFLSWEPLTSHALQIRTSEPEQNYTDSHTWYASYSIFSRNVFKTLYFSIQMGK